MLVRREDLPEGELTPEVVPGLKFRILDGNHRIRGMVNIKGEDYSMTCRVYLEFGDAEVQRTVATGVFVFGRQNR